jgi:hypothetical protein
VSFCEQGLERLATAVLSGDAFGAPALPAGCVLRGCLSWLHVPTDPGQASVKQRRQVLEPLGGYRLNIELVCYLHGCLSLKHQAGRRLPI